jgi:hypothetical protein
MYTTTGDVRGNCGHVHPTLAEAERCRYCDDFFCGLFNRSTDRRIVRTDGKPLNASEQGALDAIQAERIKSVKP